MTKALGLSVFVLAIAAPFIEWVHLAFALMTVALACILWIYLEAKKRLQEHEVDQVKLQCELEGYVRELNSRD